MINIESKHSEIDFSSVLAAAVHDMKNSLSLLLQSIDSLGHHVPSEYNEAHRHISRTHYEASRLNSNLVQLLSLYRTTIEQLPTTIDECNIFGLCEDTTAANSYYAQQRNIDITIKVDDSLSWFCDAELMYLLINDAVVNAMRYGSTSVEIAAKQQLIDQHEFLIITIADDGDGYPDTMLSERAGSLQPANLKNGRTGLGLFFARLIAHAHENHNYRGEISLSNGGSLGGSVFTVKIP